MDIASQRETNLLLNFYKSMLAVTRTRNCESRPNVKNLILAQLAIAAMHCVVLNGDDHA